MLSSRMRRPLSVLLGLLLVPSLTGLGACRPTEADHGAHAGTVAMVDHGTDGPSDRASADATHMGGHASAHVAADGSEQDAAFAHTTNDHPTASASVSYGAHDDCCPQPGMPSHCTTAPGCGTALVADATPQVPTRVTAQRTLTPFREFARPGPAPAPDVPPPKA